MAKKASTKTKSAATKPKRTPTDNVFGHHLPSPRLRLPDTGNVTALEQVVLLTELLRSHDPLNRLMQNRADTSTLTFMIDHSRTFPKYPLKGNSLCSSLQNTMREWGHQGWSVGKHQSGHYQDTKPDQNDLTLGNMQLNCQDFPEKKGNGEGLIENVSFEDLAIDVTRLPTGNDALDLTDCVIWCLHNPDSGLLYPRDFAWLTVQLGGPKTVRRANHDRRVFSRWAHANKLHKSALARARGRVRTSAKDYKNSQTNAEQQEALQVYNDASDILEAAKTPLPALVTIEDKVRVIHGELLPAQVYPGPDLLTVDLYLSQFLPNPPTVLPSLDPSASPAESESFHVDVQTPSAGPDEVANLSKDHQSSVDRVMEFSDFHGFGQTWADLPLDQQDPLTSDGFDSDFILPASVITNFSADLDFDPASLAGLGSDQPFSFGV
jgi:hypothetical protein